MRPKAITFLFFDNQNSSFKKILGNKQHIPLPSLSNRGGRDVVLQLKSELRETANLAKALATMLASLLTHEKQQETKSKERKLTSEMIVEIFQFSSAWMPFIQSMGTLESFSTITFWKSSSLANWMAQRIAEASATSGSTTSMCLVHAEWMKPLASRATTAMDKKLVCTAASVFNLTTCPGGGSHLAHGAIGCLLERAIEEEWFEILSSRPLTIAKILAMLAQEWMGRHSECSPIPWPNQTALEAGH